MAEISEETKTAKPSSTAGEGGPAADDLSEQMALFDEYMPKFLKGTFYNGKSKCVRILTVELWIRA